VRRGVDWCLSSITNGGGLPLRERHDVNVVNKVITVRAAFQ